MEVNGSNAACRLVIVLLSLASLNGQQVVNPPGGGGGGGTGQPPYTATVTALTALTIVATTHQQGVNVIAGCYNNASPPLVVGCSYSVSSIGTVVFSWNPAFTGSIIIIGGGSGVIAPATIDGSGNIVTPGNITSGSASGLSGADCLTSSTSGSQSCIAIPNNAASGMTLSIPPAGGGQNHYLSTGGGGFTDSTGGAVCGTVNKFFAIGQDSGSTTEINHVWLVPGTIGQTGVLTITSIAVGIQATESTGALTASLDYYRCGTVGSGTCTSYTGPTPTGVTVTIANGSAAGVYQSTANTFNANAGDYLAFNCVNTTGNSPNTFSLGAQIQ